MGTSMLGRDAIRHEFACDAVGPHPLVDVLPEDSPDDLGLIFFYFGIATPARRYPYGTSLVGIRPCLAIPRLPIDTRSLKLSISILPIAAMRPKVFMSMVSITAFSWT